MPTAGKADYQHTRYEIRRDSQQATWLETFSWLTHNALHGMHCKVCLPSKASAKDKLSTTGYGEMPIPSLHKLKDHETDTNGYHKANLRRAADQAEGKSQGAVIGDIKSFVSITPEDDLYVHTITTIHTMAIKQFGTSSMDALLQMQHANGALVSLDHANPHAGPGEGGIADWLEAGATVFLRRERDRASSGLMRALFPSGIPFGFLSDGSSDKSLREQEAEVLRFIGSDGHPFVSFFDLVELDLSTSADGRSPDALCIEASYVKSLSSLNSFEGFLFHSDWTKALVTICFDGASVMLGSQNGVASKLKARSPQVLVYHSGAHVAQLANSTGFNRCEYYADWKKTNQEVYAHYNGSGKKRFAVAQVAEALNESLLKFSTTHGTRWAASQATSIRAVYENLPSVVVDLEVTAKISLGLQFSLLTSSSFFVGQTFTHEFTAGTTGAPTKRYKALVEAVSRPGENAATDKFRIYYQKDKTTLEMSKSELVDRLTKDDRLNEHAAWVLRSGLVAWRFVAFSAFMMDVHTQLAILSKAFQSNSLLVSDVAKDVNRSLRVLQDLLTSAGSVEKTFHAECAKDESACVLRTCALYDRDRDLDLFNDDRKVCALHCMHAASSLTTLVVM